MHLVWMLLIAFLCFKDTWAGSRLGSARAWGHQLSLPSTGQSSTAPLFTSRYTQNPSVPVSGSSASFPPNPVLSTQVANQAVPVKTPAPLQTSIAPALTSWHSGLFGQMLMGAAVGMGVMSLVHAFGLGQDHAQGIMALLLLMTIGSCVYLVWALWRKRRGTAQVPSYGPVRMAGGIAGMRSSSGALAPMYNPKNVGNDASARPWEMGGMATAETSKGLDSTPKTIPNPFGLERLRQADQALQEAHGTQDALLDVEAFKALAKEQFLNLQDAWDRLDMNRLELFLSPDMFTLVKGQFAQRTTGPQKTEVMMLQAQWLGVQHVQGQSVASVELSGMSREAQEVSFTPFREIWSWTRPLAQDPAAWLVCGLEPLQ